jgi:hypothetical protein
MLKKNVNLLKKDNLLFKQPSRDASTQTDFNTPADQRSRSTSRRRSTRLSRFSPIRDGNDENETLALENVGKRSGSASRSRRETIGYGKAPLAIEAGVGSPISPVQERVTARLTENSRVGTPIFTSPLSPIARRRKNANTGDLVVLGVQDEDMEKEIAMLGNLDCAFGAVDDGLDPSDPSHPSMPRADLASDCIKSPDSTYSSISSIEIAESTFVESVVRASRSTRQPISYKEPSLSAKVRKGYTFFKFN